jgi:hypothetical protein
MEKTREYDILPSGTIVCPAQSLPCETALKPWMGSLEFSSADGLACQNQWYFCPV